jgi:hypothetical protein
MASYSRDRIASKAGSRTRKLRQWRGALINLLITLDRIPPPTIEQTEEALKIEHDHCHLALTAAAIFISTFDKQQGKRFFDLALNFENLNRGHFVTLFEPSRIYDRPQDPPQLWIARARAVLAIEALIRTGTKPGKAAKRIADENPRLREFAGAKAIKTSLDKVVLNWRKEFQRKRWRAGRPKSEGLTEGSLVYEQGIEVIDRLLANGGRKDVLTIADDVYEAAKSGVFSPPGPTNKS